MKRVLVMDGTTYDSLVYLSELPKAKSQLSVTSSPLNETISSTGAGKALSLTK